MNLRSHGWLDWIWNVRGELALAPGQSVDEVFGRLDPLFREKGTKHSVARDQLAFSKTDQPAQDKMSVFDKGTLRVEQRPGGAVLHYRLFSKSLLFCFLAPLLFLAFAQLTLVAGALQSEPTAAEKKKAEEKKAAAKKDAPRPQNAIDKFLGAPAPEKPKADDPAKKDDDKPSPTAAYVFAAIFAALYVGGRILEDRLVRSLFRKKLTDTNI